VMAFFAEGEPPTHTAQQKGMSRKPGKMAHIFKSGESKAARNQLVKMLRPHMPTAPLTGAVGVQLDIVFPYRLEDLRTVQDREHADLGLWVPKSTKPDLDNLEKEILDVMESLAFFLGDQQVQRKITAKWHGSRPGIWVQLTSVADEPYEGPWRGEL
jgi:Holliday junction resolvase RusA-like endonuclease